MNTQTLVLPWPTLPITANQAANMHRQVRANMTRQIRQAVSLVARKLRPVSGPVIVTTVWQVTDFRVRDTGAGTVLGKAAIDGLVDAKIITGDHWRIVVEERYRIVKGPKPELRLEILPVPASGLVAS